MKLLLVDTRPSDIIFCDYNIAAYIKRKTYGTYGRIYFTYKKNRIYLSEFVLQQDGTEVYCR